MDDGIHNKKFVKVPLCVLMDKYLSKTAIVIFCGIRSFGDYGDGSNCYPSQNTLAKRLHTSTSTIKRAIQVLKGRGHVKWVSGKRGRANEYTFCDQGSPMSDTRFTHARLSGSRLNHHREPDTEKHYQGGRKKRVLYHGGDRCFINEDGDIRIFSNAGAWVDYGGGDDDAFTFGDIHGVNAKHAAISHFLKS